LGVNETTTTQKKKNEKNSGVHSCVVCDALSVAHSGAIRDIRAHFPSLRSPTAMRFAADRRN
jgi:hypothetical protein